MKIFKMLIALTLFLIALPVYALNHQRSTLLLTIINHSKHTLSYTGVVTGTKPGNSFTISSTEILPGGSAIVTGVTTLPYVDLIGQLHFTDSTGNGNLLTVIDNRQIHNGQAVFSMKNSRFISSEQSKVFNTGQGPQALTYGVVEIVIADNYNNF